MPRPRHSGVSWTSSSNRRALPDRQGHGTDQEPDALAGAGPALDESAAGDVRGAVFIWTADGRPEVVASVYRYTENGKTVQDEEFQSLATAELTATRDGQTIWAPRTAGISLAPIPGAPRPAATAAERLRQIARSRENSMRSSTRRRTRPNYACCPSLFSAMRPTAPTCPTVPSSRLSLPPIPRSCW